MIPAPALSACLLAGVAFSGYTLAQIFPGCPTPDTVCESYGVDFVNGGTYFQNSLSTEQFSFVSQFEGCQPDIAQNLLVDPFGNQIICSNTSLTPDDTNQLSICPEAKNQLVSGPWSIIIISNNGACAPISNQRDINLEVGPQQTTTLPASTVVVTSTNTPVATFTSTTIIRSTTTVGFFTFTPPFFNPHGGPSTTTSIVFTVAGLVSQTVTQFSPSITVTTATRTATCSTGVRALFADPPARIVVTKSRLRSIQAATVTPRAVMDTDMGARAAPLENDNKFAARRHKLAKRAPDSPTITVTPSTLVTSTQIVTALNTITETIITATTSVSTATVFVVPAPPRDGGQVVTITTTLTVYVPYAVTVTTVASASVVTTTVISTPASVAATCTRNGGTIN